MTAVTPGPAGTYSGRATHAIADVSEFCVPVAQIVETAATGTHDRGVIPIETRIESSVTENLYGLRDVVIATVRELVTPIRHGVLDQTPEFTTVASPPQVLTECRALGDDVSILDIEADCSEDRLLAVLDIDGDRISEGWVHQLDLSDRVHGRPEDSDGCSPVEERATTTNRWKP